MSRTSISILVVYHGRQTDYWAVAADQKLAPGTLAPFLPHGARIVATDKVLRLEQMATLALKPGQAVKLDFVPS